MKNLYLYLITISAVTMAAMPIYGSSPASRSKYVEITGSEIERTANSFLTNLEIDYTDLWLRRNQQLEVTPLIINGADTLAMEPVYFREKNRAREERRIKFLNDRDGYNEPEKEITVRRHRNDTERKTLSYSSAFDATPWMKGSRIVVRQQFNGCEGDKTIYTPAGNLYHPVAPKMTYIIPEYDAAQSCYHELRASVNFRVDRSLIENRLEHNSEELREINAFLEKIIRNEHVSVRSLNLTGYASPEASYEHNTQLSQNRVNALRDRLQLKYSLPYSMFVVKTVPEDWDSVRRWVDRSSLYFRSQLLSIIDNTSDPDARDAKIKDLDGGDTYRILLQDLYPNLRRTEIKACMDVTPYTEAEALKLLYSNPEMLTLRDFHMLGAKLAQDSPDYGKLVQEAVKYYPEDAVMRINASSVALRNGKYAEASRLLLPVSDDPRAMNNLGIASALSGDYERADMYFGQASQNGNADAEYNGTNLYWLELPANVK